MLQLDDPRAERDALRGRTVLLAMSGGVDSSAAAVLLQRRGARVLGITMKNFCYSDVESGANTSCCSLEHMLDARRVCEALGIEHFTLDVRRDFRRLVMERFVAEYEAGRTPNPCVDCNESVRFPILLAQARALGAELVATGHYARVGRAADRWFLRRGADAAKDQSYFLHAVPEACLSQCVFPLGELEKEQVRRVARDAALPVAEKAESQEICFLPTGERREFLETHGSPRPGAVVDLEGRQLGTHAGIGNFTIGQRRGLQIAVGEPLYVQQIDAQRNTVVLGDAESLRSRGVELRPFWRRHDDESTGLRLQLRHRSAAVGVKRIECEDAITLRIEFESPHAAVAPGQAAVLYDADVVVGGGRIVAALR
ncbi:MAG: tRNA 2-thiouridine(34) synthase MnmA [Candidatus Latescibacterota bacterium]|nr:MAG: tRNA 2-thiouridine(34) synthase MnmA [Candidatus Latescibacterota bacterium]